MLDLQCLHQLLSGGDVVHVDGCAEGVQHLHLLQHVLTTRGADDEQLAALRNSKAKKIIIKNSTWRVLHCITSPGR